MKYSCFLILTNLCSQSGFASYGKKLLKKVYTKEIISELAEDSKKNLEKAGIKNVEVIEGDGGEGIPGKKFDKIMITAACPKIPVPLVEQLKEGGIIVAPIGPTHGQKMIKAKKDGEPTQNAIKKKEHLYHCEDVGDYLGEE